jgi:aspartyl-tRNA(Asn)/glutamyl-tRNA(Gln) amidotransferase subunit A
MTRNVVDCAAADPVIAGEDYQPIAPAPLAGLRLDVAQRFLQGIDETVAARFSSAVAALRRADVRLADEPLGVVEGQLAAIGAGANVIQIESYAIHRELLTKRGQDYDPVARSYFERGRGASAADYIALIRERARLGRAMDALLDDIAVVAIVLPTNKRVAPKQSELATLDCYRTQQQLLGQNTGRVNFFDLCAISLPLPREGGLPVGLMLVARNGHDHHLFPLAAAVERPFAS